MKGISELREYYRNKMREYRRTHPEDKARRKTYETRPDVRERIRQRQKERWRAIRCELLQSIGNVCTKCGSQKFIDFHEIHNKTQQEGKRHSRLYYIRKHQERAVYELRNLITSDTVMD